MQAKIQLILEGILAHCSPSLVILYSEKRSLSTSEIRAVDLLIVAETEDTAALRRKLYLAIDSPIPFNILIYSPAEWGEQCTDPGSYACAICRKGTVIYEQAP